MVHGLHWRGHGERERLGRCNSGCWLGSWHWHGSLKWPPWLGWRQQGAGLKLLGKEELRRLQELRQQRLLLRRQA